MWKKKESFALIVGRGLYFHKERQKYWAFHWGLRESFSVNGSWSPKIIPQGGLSGLMRRGVTVVRLGLLSV